MTTHCFTGYLVQRLRNLCDRFERKMSVTEIAQRELQPPNFSPHQLERPRTAGKNRNSPKHVSEDPVALSTSIPIFWDKDYTPSILTNPLRYRHELSSSVSGGLTDDATDTHFDISSRPKQSSKDIDETHFSSFLSDGSLGSTIRLHKLLPEGLEAVAASGESAFSSPVLSRRIFLPEEKKASRAEDQRPLSSRQEESAHRHSSSSPPPQQEPPQQHQQQKTALIDLRQRCTQLYSARELFADHLESAFHNLESARAELRSTKKNLSKKEAEIHELAIQVENLRKGMDLALHHHDAMARELEAIKFSSESTICTDHHHHHPHHHRKRSCLKSLFDIHIPFPFHITLSCKSTSTSFKRKINSLENSLASAEADLLTLSERYSSTHRCLLRTEEVLEEQRECMKVRIIALKHTQMELGAVRGKLQTAERVAEERRKSGEVLAQRNRDLTLEVKALRHLTAGAAPATLPSPQARGSRNITI